MFQHFGNYPKIFYIYCQRAIRAYANEQIRLREQRKANERARIIIIEAQAARVATPTIVAQDFPQTS